ncbi:hypothetical protein [Paenibacillus brasilensis]|uniref:Oligopeptide transport permease C-like N-terminal domain-containing protein n=1 Tax=Paenibacillus brasilensis TaxID=128574 RepID=A0ABU0KVR7_9BACL|nr:hypothetical protein [Paenibacillus brasilensis]
MSSVSSNLSKSSARLRSAAKSSIWQQALRQLFRNKLAMAGLLSWYLCFCSVLSARYFLPMPITKQIY